jgi:uncharacterized phiE125 gp8 family phage protein
MKFTVADIPLGTDIISLVDMKEFLRVDHSDEDTTISAIITSAAMAVQDYTGRVFLSTTYTLKTDYFSKQTDHFSKQEKHLGIPFASATIRTTPPPSTELQKQ